MQTFPNPTCLASSFFFPESLQTFQLSLSSFFHDLMTSLILQKCLLLVLDIPEIQLYFCKTLQFFCLIYFISSPTFSISPSSSQDFILNSFLLIFIHFQFCPLNHGTCRIFFSLFFCVAQILYDHLSQYFFLCSQKALSQPVSQVFPCPI